MSDKNRSYVDVMYLLTTFKQINIYHNAEKINYSKLEQDLKVLNEFSKTILPDEMMKEYKEVIFPAIQSIFGNELGLVKLKEFLKNINGRIITGIRASLIQFQGLFQDLKYKENLIEKMILIIKQYHGRCDEIKRLINFDFTNKEQFLMCCKNMLVKTYRGDLYLNNSSMELVKTLEKILDHVYDPNGPSYGQSVIDKYKIPDVLDSIKFYINREEIQKTNLDEFLKFNQDDIKQEKDQFQVLPGKDIDYIIKFIKSTHQPSVDTKPDDPQGNSIIWSNLIFKLGSLTQRTQELFDTNIKIKLKTAINFPVSDLSLMVDKIDELYKIQDTTGDIDRYLKLLALSMMVYEQYLELVVYDIYSYITSLEYINFISQLTYSICAKFLDEKEQTLNKEKSVQKDKDPSGEEDEDDSEDDDDDPEEDGDDEDSEDENKDQGQEGKEESQEEQGQPTGEGFFDWFRKKDKDDGTKVESSIRLDMNWEDEEEEENYDFRIDFLYDCIATEDKWSFHNYVIRYDGVKNAVGHHGYSDIQSAYEGINEHLTGKDGIIKEMHQQFDYLEKMVHKTKNLKDKYQVSLSKVNNFKDLDALEKHIKDLYDHGKDSEYDIKINKLLWDTFQDYKKRCEKLLKLVLDNSKIINQEQE